MDNEGSQCHLLRLPPELREKIYSFYFDEEVALPRGNRPVEPPLTYVSKWLRSECLPIYYSNYHLRIQAYVKCDFYGHVTLKTNTWYHRLHHDKLRHIERFRIRFVLIQQYSGELVPIEFQISLHPSKHSYSMSHSFDKAWFRSPHRTGDPADFEDIVSVLKAHLDSTLEALLEDPGIGNLGSAHLDRLMRVDAESLPL